MKTNGYGAETGAGKWERGRLLTMVTTLLFVVSIIAVAIPSEVSGEVWDGTSATSYEAGTTDFTIASGADLKGLANWVNTGNDSANITVSLTTDINLGGHDWTPIGLSYRNGSDVTDTSNAFKGTFDGNGYAITGLNVDKNDYSNSAGNEVTLGLFGALNAATVQDLIVGGKVTGYDATGLIAGFMFNDTTIKNCFTTDGSTVVGDDNTGGIVGKSYGGIIQNCSNYADVTSNGTKLEVLSPGVVKAKAGGIVAHVDNRTNVDTKVNFVSNSGTITTEDTLSGGIVGFVQASGVVSITGGIQYASGLAMGKYTENANITVADVGTTAERWPGVNITATICVGTAYGVNLNNSSIYLQGNEATIDEGVTDGWTKLISDGQLICYGDLSGYTIYGGSYGADATSSTITMNGGTLYAVIGGGGMDASVGTATITINGGTLTYGVAAGGYCGTLSATSVDVMKNYNYVGTATITINGGDIGQAIAGGFQSYAYVESSTMNINGGDFGNIIAGGVNGYTAKSVVTIDASEGAEINASLVSTANRGEIADATISIVDLGSGSIDTVAVGVLEATTSTDGGPNGVVDKLNLTIRESVDINNGVYLGAAAWDAGKHNPWDTTTENALIKADLTINTPGRTIIASDYDEVEPDTGAYGVDYIIGTEKTWNIVGGTLLMTEGHSLIMQDGANLSGTIAGPDGNGLTLSEFTAGDETKITAGPFVIDGSWSGEMIVSGDDITITGAQSKDTKIIVKPQEDGTPSNVTWKDFEQNCAQIEYRDLKGNVVEPSEVANQTYVNATFDDETHTGTSYSVSVKVSGGNGFVSGIPETVAEGGSFTFSFSSASGYEIGTVTCTGASNYVVSGTTSGTVTISGVTGPVEVVVTFVESAASNVPVDDEDDLPPFIPTQPQQDDDTTTIVACAAAAVVAALMAVFLIMEYRKR